MAETIKLNLSSSVLESAGLINGSKGADGEDAQAKLTLGTLTTRKRKKSKAIFGNNCQCYHQGNWQISR